MVNGYFNITVTIEWVSFLAALLFLDRRTGRWRWFIVFLFCTLCAETAGWFIRTQLHKPNALPFNLLLLTGSSFFIWFLYQSGRVPVNKTFITWGIITFLAFGIVNLIFIQGFWVYNAYSETLADIILVILC